jgi:hypothetical protein
MFSAFIILILLEFLEQKSYLQHIILFSSGAKVIPTTCYFVLLGQRGTYFVLGTVI